MGWGTCYADDDLASRDPCSHAKEYFVAGMEMVKGSAEGDDGVAGGGRGRGGLRDRGWWTGMGWEEGVWNGRKEVGEGDVWEGWVWVRWGERRRDILSSTRKQMSTAGMASGERAPLRRTETSRRRLFCRWAALEAWT